MANLESMSKRSFSMRRMEQRLLAGGVTDERIEMPEMAPDTHEEGASVRNTLKATAITRPGREAAAEKKAEAA